MDNQEMALVNLPSVARNFPRIIDLEIKRDNIVYTMENLLQKDIQVLLIEGVDGVGKTNLLSQFARKNSESSISIFIEPSNKYAYNKNYLEEIVSEQVSFIINERPLEEDEFDKSYLQKNMSKLQRKAQRIGGIYFIVDGLTDIPDSSEYEKKLIIQELLPIGLSGFKFIMSGDLGNFNDLLRDNISRKSLPLSNFSLDETTKYFGDIDLEELDVQEIHRMCKGLPGHLDIVKRQIRGGTPVESIFSEEPTQLPDFISLEWNKLDKSLNNEERKALILIAISKRSLTKSDLIETPFIEIGNVESFLKKVEILEEINSEIRFISYPHKKFILNELSGLKDEVMDLQVKHLLDDIYSQESVNELPDLLEDKGDIDQLMDVLSPEYFRSALKHTQSLYYIYKRSEQGVNSAKSTKSLNNLFRYSLQKSVLYELLKKRTTEEELEARLIVEDYDTALNLAQSSFTKEERVYQLCIVVKYLKKNDRNVSKEIIEQIRLLVQQVDSRVFKDKGIEIASNLIWIDPDLAIEVVEKSLELKEDDNALDFAFAKLSIEAFEASNKEPQYKDVVEKTKSKISDPNLQNFINAASSYTGKLTAKEAINVIDPLETKSKVFILRQWLQKSSLSDDVDKVIEYSLDQLVSTLDYTPKIRDLREISTPLKQVKNKVKVEELIGRIDSLVTTMGSLGTSVEYVRLQLNLSICEYNIGAKSKAQNRCIDIYYYIDGIEDVITRTECLAWFFAFTKDIDPISELEEKDGLISLIKDGLEEGIELIITQSASHYISLKGVFEALCINHFSYVLEVIDKINTQARKDEALTSLLEHETSKDIEKIDLEQVKNTLGNIYYAKHRENCYLKVIENLCSNSINDSKNIFLIKDMIDEIGKREIKCICRAQFLKLLINQEKDELIEKNFKELDRCWDSIDCRWSKINIGYTVSAILSESSKEIGLNFLQKIDEYNQDSGIDNYESALIFILCIRISIRLFSGLIKNELYNESDLNKLAGLINKIPSVEERASLWTDLALRCFSEDGKDIGNRIVEEYLLKIISNLNSEDVLQKEIIISNSAPAIYIYHNNTLSELLGNLTKEYREYAVDNICTYILRNKSLDDPYRSGPVDSFRLSNKDVLDILSLMDNFETDVFIYRYVDDITTSLKDKKNKRNISRQQKYDIAYKLKEIVIDKLPDKANIKHEGFVIASISAIYSITNNQREDWQDLVERADKINNESDKAFVLGIIAKNINENKFNDIYTLLVDKIDETIIQNSSIIERVNRYYDVANLFAGKNSMYFRRNLEKAFESTNNNNHNNIIADKQKNIIDLAHSIDPHFASSLISIIDNDPARGKEKNKASERVNFLNKKKELGDRKILDVSLNDDQYAEAAWMNLGSLNAGMLETFHLKNFFDHVEKSSELDISHSFAVLSWVVENAKIRFSDSNDMKKTLKDLFISSVSCCELAYYFDRVSHNSVSEYKSKSGDRLGDEFVKNTVHIKEGERDKAISFIRNWVRDNATSYIKICDPYFSLTELEFIKLIKEEIPDCRISVLLGNQKSKGYNFQQEYSQHWNLKVSESEPPIVKFVIATLGDSQNTPIHDRWIITENAGLKIGTSLNSLGIGKVSEISVLGYSEVEEKETELDNFLNMERFSFNGEKVNYNVFNL